MSNRVDDQRSRLFFIKLDVLYILAGARVSLTFEKPLSCHMDYIMDEIQFQLANPYHHTVCERQTQSSVSISLTIPSL